MQKEVGGGVVLLAMAAAYLWATLQIPESSLSDEVGARGLPLVLATALAVVAVLIITKGAIAALPRSAAAKTMSTSAATTAESDDDDRYESTLPRALGLLSIGALYIVVALLAGYVPALVVLIGSIALYEGIAPGWRPLTIALGGAGFYWLVFVKLLGTAQPAGMIGGLF